jgi:hypothetical protein
VLRNKLRVLRNKLRVLRNKLRVLCARLLHNTSYIQATRAVCAANFSRLLVQAAAVLCVPQGAPAPTW